MNVLVLAPHSFYVDRGTPMDTDLLVRALSARGEQVDLVVYRDGEDRHYPNVTIHRAALPDRLTGVGPGFSIRKVLADLYLLALTRRLVRRNQYDLVHASEEMVFPAMWLKWWRGLPYVYDMDSSIAQQMVEKYSWLWPLAWFFNWCETRAIRGAVAVAPVCNALRDLARQRGAAHIETLHDISQLREPGRPATGQLRQRLSLDHGPILMYVGNLERYQGVDLLLEAYAIAAQRGAAAHLVIAGGSDAAIEAYRAKTTQLKIAERTHFLGRWPADRLDELLAEADILTAPRIKGINTPMKIFPYLHSGRPVLVTDLPTHTQLLTPEVAMLAPPEPEGFAEAILRLSGDAALRQRLGEAGRAFVERNHTFEAHQRRVDRLYDYVARVISKGRPQTA